MNNWQIFAIICIVDKARNKVCDCFWKEAYGLVAQTQHLCEKKLKLIQLLHNKQ